MIKIQKKDFNIDKEIQYIKTKHPEVGAISTFIGYVRNTNKDRKVTAINLEVYNEMAFKLLNEISLKAKKKWDIIDSLVIHRYGKILVNQKIVLVATFSMHRDVSFKACNFIMNHLKKDAPFWKKEFYQDDYKWLQNSK